MISGSESIDLYYLKYFIISKCTDRVPLDTIAASAIHIPKQGQRNRARNIPSNRQNAVVPSQHLGITSILPQPPPPPPPSAHQIGGCCTGGSCSVPSISAPISSPPPQLSFAVLTAPVIESVIMLIGRLAIILSLVGWRVKPDPGD